MFFRVQSAPLLQIMFTICIWNYFFTTDAYCLYINFLLHPTILDIYNYIFLISDMQAYLCCLWHMMFLSGKGTLSNPVLPQMRRWSWPPPVWRPCWGTLRWPSTPRTPATNTSGGSPCCTPSATARCPSSLMTLWTWTLEQVGRDVNAWYSLASFIE